MRVAALAPRFQIGQDETIRKIFFGAVAIDPDSPPPGTYWGAASRSHAALYAAVLQPRRDGFADLVEVAREYGVKVLYEIHVGTVAVSCSAMVELLRDWIRSTSVPFMMCLTCCALAWKIRVWEWKYSAPT